MSWEADLDRLVTERGSALVAYAYLLVGDMASAEDLVQDALVRTYSRRRPEDDHLGRGVRAARHPAHLPRRLPGPRPVRGGHAAGRDPRQRWTTRPPRRVTGPTSPGRSTALSPRERACVVLRFYDDLTLPEIGLPPRCLRRGREALPVRRPAQARAAARPAAGPVDRGRHDDHEGRRAMNRDLESALERAGHPRGAAATVPPGHRCRSTGSPRAPAGTAARARPLVVAGAAAAVVVVAGTAFAVLPDRAPAPPAHTPTPTVTTSTTDTPTPTRSPTVRPSSCPWVTPHCRSAPADPWRTPPRRTRSTTGCSRGWCRTPPRSRRAGSWRPAATSTAVPVGRVRRRTPCRTADRGSRC